MGIISLMMKTGIKIHIYRLRKKIEVDYHTPHIIMSKQGIGYYLAADFLRK